MNACRNALCLTLPWSHAGILYGAGLAFESNWFSYKKIIRAYCFLLIVLGASALPFQSTSETRFFLIPGLVIELGES